ncbi:hypothetical protein LCGC14_1147460 [marine sediment metagenome]|uniref:Uncharacterized protein n=1 Tax=marine sediment metagenome TaxID=412755 RepID=A0A0F9LWH2_9ZZZZ
MYDLKPGQLVECDWLDPAAASEWQEAKHTSVFWRIRCRSVGYVHLVGVDGVILTASYGEDPDGDRALLLRQHLPWNCITDVWVLREPE